MVGAADTGTLVDVYVARAPAEASGASASEAVNSVSAAALPRANIRSRTVVDVRFALKTRESRITHASIAAVACRFIASCAVAKAKFGIVARCDFLTAHPSLAFPLLVL
jgi:hypothetical protein